MFRCSGGLVRPFNFINRPHIGANETLTHVRWQVGEFEHHIYIFVCKRFVKRDVFFYDFEIEVK